MNAHNCPNCGSRLMSFSEFFRSARPSTVATCRGCGVQLRRGGAVWVLLFASFLILAGLAVALTITNWSPLQILLVMLVAFPLWLLAVKFIGWTLVPWQTFTSG
jgi:uncharacterized protein (DUF983 family)